MKQCPNGHIYDEKMHSACPYCRNDGSSGVRPLGNASDFPSTLPMGGAAAFSESSAPDPNFPKTAPLNAGGAFGGQSNASNSFPETIPVGARSSGGGSSNKMSKTVALNPVSYNEDGKPSAGAPAGDDAVNPVCGWIVAVDGGKTGYPFTIHSERNTIGRGAEFDVDIWFDGAVSSKGDAVISFDSIGKKFYISPGSGRNNVHVNDRILLTPIEINDYDRIRIGTTTFVFRSFCGEQFMY
ncbi:MAG: FHA domain-containing protein [Oscillospiraceae bacterium]|nr:FHA domain-containing protein [Oscillospiraceae bacterium]